MIKTEKAVIKNNLYVYARDMGVLLFSFFLGRAVFFDSFAIFGLSFLCAYLNKFKNKAVMSVFVAVSSLAGTLSLFDGMLFMKNLLSYIVFGLLYTIVSIFKERTGEMEIRCFSLVSVALSGSLFIGLEGLYSNSLPMLFSECTLCFLAVTFMKSAVNFLSEDLSEEALKPEMIIPFYISSAIAVMGLSTISIFGFSLGKSAIAFLIMTASLCGGVALGTSAGLCIGFVGMLQLFCGMEMISICAGIGFGGGVLRRFKKGGVILGVFLANSVFALYTMGFGNSVFTYGELFVASVLLLAVPFFIIERIRIIIECSEDKNTKLCERLTGMAESWAGLGKTFERIMQKTDAVKIDNEDEAIHKACSSVCKMCGLKFVCHEKEREETNESFLKIKKLLLKNKEINLQNIPECFSKKCIKSNEFVNELNIRHKQLCLNKGRDSEKNAVLFSQFENFSEILENTAKSIKDEGSGIAAMERLNGKGLCFEFGALKKTRYTSEENGDNFCYVQNDSKAYVMLCDGMGSGKDASERSSLAIYIFGYLCNAGFDELKAIELINCILCLSCNEKECFTTIDLLCIDKISGQADFYKMGATASYIISDDGVKVVFEGSMPVGILDKPDVKKITHNVAENDVIIMSSDGAELFKNDKFDEILHSSRNKTAGDICEEIMEHCLGMCNGKAPDDISIAVVGINKIRERGIL